MVSDIGESEVEGGLRNLVSRVKALVYLMVDDYLLALKEYGDHIKYNNNNSTVWTETYTQSVFGCVVASAFEATTTTQPFGNAPTTDLYWWALLLIVAQPQVYKKQLFAASCAGKTHEKWSHAPLFMGFLQ